MDNRKFILTLLETYTGFDEQEELSRKEIIQFIKDHKQCFENDFKLGHVTGSALVVDQACESTLLTHHIHLNKWFQFGGHSDGQWNTIEVGWREAQEESGLTKLHFLPGHEGIFDVDVHAIPTRGDMPEHKHYDIRILLAVDKNEPYIVSHESKDLNWVKLTEAQRYNAQPAFLRLIKKAQLLKTQV